MALVITVQAVAQGVDRSLLALAVYRGDDADAVGVDVGVHQFHGLQAGHFAQIGGVHFRRGGMEAGADRGGLGQLALLGGEGAGLFHAMQNPVASHLGTLGVGDRVIG